MIVDLSPFLPYLVQTELVIQQTNKLLVYIETIR